MKNKLFLILGMLCFNLTIFACDLCSIYVNMEPNDLKNSFGINYRSRTFEHSKTNLTEVLNSNKHAIGNTYTEDYVTQKEHFISYDLWANYFIKEKWQIFANFSFADNSYYENDSLLHNVSGIGDITLLLKHITLNSKITDSSKLTYRLQLSGGVNIPVGNFNKTYVVTPSTSYKGNAVYTQPYQEIDPHLQAGTGSWGVIGMAEFLIKYYKLGLNTNLSYRTNSTNKNGFQFASRYNTNTSLFYQISANKLTIIPLVGISTEFSNRDQLNNQEYLNSGGSSTFFTSGIKLAYKKMAIGATYWSPIRQELRDNQLPNKHRLISNLTYYF